MWKTHGWPACAILVWLIITIPHYPHLLANPLGPYEKFRATDWWKWWKMIKNEKNSRHSPFLFFFRCSREFIICLSFFNQFSCVFQGNRGTWINIIRKWWEMIKQRLNNDKNMIKKPLTGYTIPGSQKISYTWITAFLEKLDPCQKAQAHPGG